MIYKYTNMRDSYFAENRFTGQLTSFLSELQSETVLQTTFTPSMMNKHERLKGPGCIEYVYICVLLLFDNVNSGAG